MSGAFDTNTWYNIFWEGTTPHTAVTGFDINNSGTGAIIEEALNATSGNANQTQWQVLPIGPTDTYVIRSRYLGHLWYMGTFWNPANTPPGTADHLCSKTFDSPDSVIPSSQWIIRPSNDSTGSYYFSTVQNTTAYNLAVYGQAAYMQAAGTATSAKMFDWTLTSVGEINDAQWSFTPTATPSTSTTSNKPTSTSSSTSSSTNSPTSESHTSNPAHSSTPTGAIVGGVIGGVAVLLILIGALIFWGRRRRQTKRSRDDMGNRFSKSELAGTLDNRSQSGSVVKDLAHYGGTPAKVGGTIHEKPAWTPTNEPLYRSTQPVELAS